ncbi:MAG: c-type cytochrome biogenesis protein CcmI [Alphaproteobacteria bacterium HGW-Alphaproteobacteria-12]|nr:MAG: c-type cytochrome biogenesis protein CcmI [Alphaproteobacteria bacterium HGW-Alphaproteobacteria-12]
MLLPANDIFLFLAFAALTGLALWLMLRPLRTGSKAAEADMGDSEVALYRDQLEEIERDLERGIIGMAEAEAARVEVSRRLLAADEERTRMRSTGTADPRWRKGTALVLALAVPALAIVVYLAEGSPGMEGRPFAERMNVPPEELPLEGLVLRIERHLKKAPDDLHGWELVAPVYLQLGRFEEAANAWSRAMMVGGVTGGRLAARGEARVMANDGVVGPAAKRDFEKAVEIDPQEPRAQYFLGVAELDAGNRDAALERWKRLLASAPEDAPWATALRARVATVERGPEVSSADEPMIRGMVDGLATRLEEDPNDLEGWLRLIRSYEVLNEPAMAREAVANAKAAFAGNDAALARISDAEKSLSD